MKMYYLALMIPAAISFSTVAGDANFTTDRIQKPVIEHQDMNQMLQTNPSAAGSKQVQPGRTNIKPAPSILGSFNSPERGPRLGGDR